MPARLRDLKRVLEQMGLRLEPPSGSSHWKVYDAAGKCYPIPAGNGLKTEVSDVYLRGLCRAFGLDLGALKKLL